LLRGCDNNPWLLDTQSTLQLATLVEPTKSAEVAEDLMFCLQPTSPTADKPGCNIAHSWHKAENNKPKTDGERNVGGEFKYLGLGNTLYIS